MIKDNIPPVDESGSPERELPAIEDASALLARDVETPPLLIEGLLHKGSKLVLGGSSKSMKTWTLLDMAISVATGEEWWGMRTYPVRVLYANFELETWSLKYRLDRILSARGLTLSLDQLDFWNLRGFAADIDNLVPAMIERTHDRNYGMIALDPIYKCLGKRDENKAGDITSLMNQLERLTVETGAALVFGAHFSKGNQSAKESIDRIGGSGVFARDPDSILLLTPHEVENAFTVEATLRNLPRPKPFVVQWECPLMKVTDFDPAALRKPGGRMGRIKPDPLEVLELFPKRAPKNDPRKGVLSNKELTDLFKARNFDPDALVECRNELERRGEIKVITGPRYNEKLAGLPDAADAYERSRERADDRN